MIASGCEWGALSAVGQRELVLECADLVAQRAIVGEQAAQALLQRRLA
jgi:hypothetical protein